MTPRLPLLVSAVALVVALALAGCSIGIPSAPATGAPSPIASSSGSGSAAVAPDPTKACTLVSVAQAQGALRTDPAVTLQQPGTFVDGEPECGYASDDEQTIIVNVTIWSDTSRFDLHQAVVSDDALSPVSGVGDEAAVGPIELDFLIGSRGVTVESFGSTDVGPDQLVALGRLIAAALR